MRRFILSLTFTFAPYIALAQTADKVHAPQELQILGVTISATAAAAIGVLFGALVSSALTLLVEWLKARREAILSLHREWYEMMDIRAAVDEKLSDYSSSSSNPDETFLRNVWKVQAFYERLNFYCRRRLISRNLVRDLFGENLHWWHENVFTSHINKYPKTQSSQDVFALHRSVWKRASEEQKERWELHASRPVTIAKGNFTVP